MTSPRGVRSAKGSARDAVNDFMRFVDPEWSRNRILSGFGSGDS